MFPYSNLQGTSTYDKLIILIEKLSCVGCGNEATSGNGGTTTDAGMSQLLIKAIERLSCGQCA